jgi:hypothetical protein
MKKKRAGNSLMCQGASHILFRIILIMSEDRNIQFLNIVFYSCSSCTSEKYRIL